MAQPFIVDHIEYKTFRSEQYCLKVKTIDQGQERQYFINTYGIILSINVYLLSSFYFFLFLILQWPEMSIMDLHFFLSCKDLQY